LEQCRSPSAAIRTTFAMAGRLSRVEPEQGLLCLAQHLSLIRMPAGHVRNTSAVAPVRAAHAPLPSLSWCSSPPGARPASPLRSYPLRKLGGSGFAVPFLERLVRNLSVDKKLRELPSLRLTLERHERPIRPLIYFVDPLDVDPCRSFEISSIILRCSCSVGSVFVANAFTSGSVAEVDWCMNSATSFLWSASMSET